MAPTTKRKIAGLIDSRISLVGKVTNNKRIDNVRGIFFELDEHNVQVCIKVHKYNRRLDCTIEERNKCQILAINVNIPDSLHHVRHTLDALAERHQVEGLRKYRPDECDASLCKHRHAIAIH